MTLLNFLSHHFPRQIDQGKACLAGEAVSGQESELAP